MPKILGGVPATAAASTSATVACQRAQQYTLAIWGNTTKTVTVNLYGAFDTAFSPQWLISAVTACAGGATGSGRYADIDDYFPYKRVVATMSASEVAASHGAFAVYLENREF